MSKAKRRSIASRGGTARAKALTPERRSEIARTAATARWEKMDPSTTKQSKEIPSEDSPGERIVKAAQRFLDTQAGQELLRKAVDAAHEFRARSRPPEIAGALDDLLAVLKAAALNDGEHHKQYAIDQTLRHLLGPTAYKAWRAELLVFDEERSDEDYDEGSPP